MIVKLKIESKLGNLRIVENAINEVTEKLGISQDNYGKILVSVLEAVSNAILHGNRSQRGTFVDIQIAYKEDKIVIKVIDEGEGFIPENLPDPTSLENIESINGRGVYLMAHLADKIKYNKRGNIVKMYFENL